MSSEPKKRGRPRKPKEEEVIVKRPVKMGQPVKPEAWDGKFKSVEPMKHQKKARQKPYKWNHHATINWIMGQADPVGFLASVMQGKEIFPVYAKDAEGLATEAALTGDPELLVQAVALDPLTSAALTLKEIRNMVSEMLEAQRTWLPQFESRVVRPTPTIDIPKNLKRVQVPLDPALAIANRFGLLAQV